MKELYECLICVGIKCVLLSSDFRCSHTMIDFHLLDWWCVEEADR